MQIAFGNVAPAGAAGGLQTSAATVSFTHQPMETWTAQRLDSPIGQRFLQAISQVTGISQADVTSQLQSGTPLHDILETKGATFAQVRDAARAQGGQVQFHGRRRPQGGAPDAALTAALNGLAGSLGISTSNLEQQLGSGMSLDAIAASRGVSQDTLQASMEQAIQSLLGYAPTGSQAGATLPSGIQVDTNA